MRKLILLGIILAFFSACSSGGGGNGDNDNDETCPVIVASDAHHEVFAKTMEDGMVMVTTVDFGPNTDVEAVRAAVIPPHCPVPCRPSVPRG